MPSMCRVVVQYVTYGHMYSVLGVPVQRTSTDVHNWITFSVTRLVLAQSKTSHLYLMTRNPIWPNADGPVLLPQPR